jgi:hypothetical protein
MIRVEQFNIRWVDTGDQYGAGLTNAQAPMVEFYQPLQAPEVGGLFLARYLASRLLKAKTDQGLYMEPVSLSPEGLRQVQEWIIDCGGRE